VAGHPELAYEEHHAHDAGVAFMKRQGFEVTPHYHLETAWLASFTHGTGGRTIGINSEVRRRVFRILEELTRRKFRWTHCRSVSRFLCAGVLINEYRASVTGVGIIIYSPAV
jgi:hypothetical protein